MQKNFINIWDLKYIKRSPLDEQGNLYPILYMKLEKTLISLTFKF